MHWPGANVMFVIGAALLALIYLPLILHHKLKESPRNEALMHIAGFVGLAFTTVGSLFKIMHWPGASVLLMVGMGTLAFIYVPVYFYKKYQVSANKPITFSASLVAMTCLILVFALTRVNNSKNYDFGLTLIDAQLRTSVENTSNNNLLYAQLENESKASDIRNAASAAISQLRLTRASIIASVDNISVEEASTMKLSDVRNSSDFRTPTDILFNSTDGEQVNVETLVNELNSFKSVVVNTYSPNLQQQVEATFPFNTNANFKEEGKDLNWSEYSFYKVPVIGVLSNLSKLESEIRQAENQALIYLISRPEASNPPS
jgi:Ca2+/Na+ antiporter